MIAHTPTAVVRVDIPNTCTMRGELTPDVDLRFLFGEPRDGITIVFERPALERFVHLAIDLLATPCPDERAPADQVAGVAEGLRARAAGRGGL